MNKFDHLLPESILRDFNDVFYREFNMPEANKIPYNAVESSQVSGEYYDGEKKQLFIRFVRGGEYRYENVEQHHVDLLRKSDSFGSTFHTLIKKFPAEFPYTKISG